MFMATNIGMAMAFVSAHYVFFYVKERVIKAKHLQFLSGVGVFMFWGTSVLYDLLSFAVIVILIVIAVVAFQVEGYNSFEDIGKVRCVLGFAFEKKTCFRTFLSGAPSIWIFNVTVAISWIIYLQRTGNLLWSNGAF